MTEKRLSKVLAACGVASRRAAEKLIFEGKVTVNGKEVLVPQTLVDPARDKITVDGERIGDVERKVYYLLNKPKKCVCTSAPIKGRRVIDLFDSGLRLFTVGRLDKDTTGLLIVTNDGVFANNIIHPSSCIEKEYLAKVNREISHDDLVKIAKGGFVEGSYVKPKKVQKIRRGTLKIVVMEGKKHEVRLLLEKYGFLVTDLERIRLGSLTLGTLPYGAWRPLSEREKKLIFE
jgi:23S rRNA pseudouridine2605 synthase